MPVVVPLRPCPICGSAKSKTLYRQSFEQLSGVRLLNGYGVAICDSCGAGFAADIPEQQVFDEYYRDLSKYDYADHGGIEPPEAEQRFQEIAAVLKDFIPAAKSRILEIGSASGQLLRVLRGRGYANVLGADPSPGCVRAAQAFYGIQLRKLGPHPPPAYALYQTAGGAPGDGIRLFYREDCAVGSNA